MPLAHPVSITTTSNYSQPAVAVSFVLARPGESVDDFQARIASRGEWGQTRYGRDKVELVLTVESVEELLRRLVPLVAGAGSERWSTRRDIGEIPHCPDGHPPT